jgi:tRNA 2-thiouridine synthesizing protein A
MTAVPEITDRTIDAVGLYCPEPILKLAEHIKTMEEGQTLKIMADDPGSLEDIPAWCRRTGHLLVSIEQNDSIICAIIRKSKK